MPESDTKVGQTTEMWTPLPRSSATIDCVKLIRPALLAP